MCLCCRSRSGGFWSGPAVLKLQFCVCICLTRNQGINLTQIWSISLQIQGKLLLPDKTFSIEDKVLIISVWVCVCVCVGGGGLTQKLPGTIIKSLGIGECTTMHDGILLKLRRYAQIDSETPRHNYQKPRYWRVYYRYTAQTAQIFTRLFASWNHLFSSQDSDRPISW